MDWIAYNGKAREWLKKYRYVLIVLLAGIVLMLLPAQKETPAAQPVPTQPETTLQESLTEILSMVSGAGEVRVLLTEAAGEETVYQLDEDSDDSGLRRETVLVSDTNREKAGLVRRVNGPEYLGAVIVCQGADSAAVRLAIVEAVKSATGLSSDRISVLKMK